jgi:hypothetical protein
MKGDFPDKDKKSGYSFGYLNKKHYLCKRKNMTVMLCFKTAFRNSKASRAIPARNTAF